VCVLSVTPEMPNQNFQNAGDLAGSAPEMLENRAEAKKKKKKLQLAKIRCDIFRKKKIILQYETF